jgi:hypothetical protein
MNAVKYMVLITPDPVHRYMDREIEEIFIPELGICINNAGGCFDANSSRDSNVTQIQIDENSVATIKAFKHAKQDFDAAISNIFQYTSDV